ncbi:MAG: SRPBCC family protein [Planctomycetes bacterium]|nr:SRPBCC family protein [Planctomycetota bacterium]
MIRAQPHEGPVLQLRLPFQHEVSVAASPEETFRLLADVSDSAAHFPQIEAVVPQPAGAWTWRLEKIGLGKISVQTVYALRYTQLPDEHTISWEPVAGIGNGTCRGSWVIVPTEAGVRLKFENVLDVRFRGIPSLLRRVVEPFAIQENARIVRGYMENLGETLSGGDGRVGAKS